MMSATVISLVVRKTDTMILLNFQFPHALIAGLKILALGVQDFKGYVNALDTHKLKRAET